MSAKPPWLADSTTHSSRQTDMCRLSVATHNPATCGPASSYDLCRQNGASRQIAPINKHRMGVHKFVALSVATTQMQNIVAQHVRTFVAKSRSDDKCADATERRSVR